GLERVVVRRAGEIGLDAVECRLRRAPDWIVRLEAIRKIERRDAVEGQGIVLGVRRCARGDRAHWMRVVVDRLDGVDVAFDRRIDRRLRTGGADRGEYEYCDERARKTADH